MKSSDNIIILLVLIILILIIVSELSKNGEIETIEDEIIEESVGSGLIEIETFPNDAEIFVDDVYEGISPTTLFNIPVGPHNIIIKKEGYEDFIEEIIIEAGRKAFLEANLIPIFVEQPEIIEVEEEIIEEETEEIDLGTETSNNVISIGNEFLFYYDFSEKKFTSERQVDSDMISRIYFNYFIFTRTSPVNIKAIGKNINDVVKEDCIDIKGQFEYLHSGESLCVITKENEIVAIGGEWEYIQDANLVWKLLN